MSARAPVVDRETARLLRYRERMARLDHSAHGSAEDNQRQSLELYEEWGDLRDEANENLK